MFKTPQTVDTNSSTKARSEYACTCYLNEHDAQHFGQAGLANSRLRQLLSSPLPPTLGLETVSTPFADFDLSDFWEDSDYARREYVGPPFSDLDVKRAEKELGYRLPRSYIELMRIQNGGIPKRTNHRMNERTSWAETHIAITGIYSIGQEKTYSLCGAFSSKFWVAEWGYPPIGIYFADCPSAGHDMLCLDYRKCGPEGEPQVVHIDQEWDYKITLVSENFESFVRGLEGDDAFDET